MFELQRTFRFESAHLLPRVPEGHKCRRLHGHSFECEVYVRGPLQAELDWVLDFGDLKALVQPTIDLLDHRFLNEIEGLENPTSEVLARWIWRRTRHASVSTTAWLCSRRARPKTEPKSCWRRRSACSYISRKISKNIWLQY